MIEDPDFDTWLALVFDPSAGDDPFHDWYWSAEADPFRLSPPVLADHLLRLLEAPGRHLELHHDNQVASGLDYLFNPACGGDVRDLGHPSVAHADRLEIMARLPRLWAELVVPRAPQALGHLSEDGGRLAAWAYMVWDVCALDVPADPAEARTYAAAQVEAMGAILALPHAAAQESALHGLGHDGSPQAITIIDRWLADGTPARPELLPYARAARTGCIL